MEQGNFENDKPKKGTGTCANELLCILTFLFGAASLVVLVLAMCSISSNDQPDYIEYFCRFAELFVLTFTLRVALDTYQQSRKIENTKGLAQIREMLSAKGNMEVHKALAYYESLCQTSTIKNSTKPDSKFPKNIEKYYNEYKHEVNHYLGTLELAKIYLDEEVISSMQFYQQFGYRIENAEMLMPILEKEETKGVPEGHYWLDLFKLCDQISQMKQASKAEYEEYLKYHPRIAREHGDNCNNHRKDISNEN